MTKPHLEKKADFEAALSDYKVSEAGKALLGGTTLALLVSPTSAGRNTLIKELVETGKYEYIVSDTTRSKRQNDGVWEQDGIEYWFRTESEFLADLEKGMYLEAELIHQQQVSGISLRELKKAALHDKIAINEVDHDGIKNVHLAKPDTFAILILPPSAEAWMKRWKKRGEITDQERRNRLNTARDIFKQVEERDYYKIVVNDDLQTATEKIRRIVEDGEYSEEEHRSAQALAAGLLAWVERELKN